MFIDLSMQTTVKITSISTEDFYNYLYWDYRIYDLRSQVDYIRSHICRAHSMNPSSVITVDVVAEIDAQIVNDYGKAEQPSEILLYADGDTHDNRDAYMLQMQILKILVTYLTSNKNPHNNLLTKIHILTDGFENFHTMFPFLCSDHLYYIECSQLSWPSYIIPHLYLGSSMCRNELVMSMLKITHIMSLSDYAEKPMQSCSFETLHWQVADSSSTNLLAIFPRAVVWISKAINHDGGNVLVHCDQGVSRSASIVIAYLLYSNTNFCTVEDALDYVRSKRSIVKPNASFLQQLEQYIGNRDVKK